MLAEHLVYNAAIAIVVGMIFFRFTGRDNSWIIILVTYVPDLDKITGPVLRQFGITVLIEGQRIQHGTFHNIAVMVVFAVLMGFLLHPFGIPYFDSCILSAIGFSGHLFEDALVYPASYKYLWPFSNKLLGLAWLPTGISEESYTANFLHIANAEVLSIGLVILLGVALFRTWYEGTGWIRWYMPEKVYRNIFLPSVKEKTP